MPDSQRVLHCVRDYDVAGVNWRPTLFAEEFLQPHACCLCRVIPKGTTLLPCSHALCEACQRGSLRRKKTGGTCPLCGETFAQYECQAIKISPKKASSLKAHCWNYANGCRFVDVLAAVLQHYERECNFHSTPCLSCGKSVLHRDLPSHYRSGCRSRKLRGKRNRQAGQGDTTGGEGAFSAPAEPKPAVDYAVLSALQSQMNELTRQMQELGQALQKASGTLTDVELGLDSELFETLEKFSVVSDNANKKRVRFASQSSTGSGEHASGYSRRIGPGLRESAAEQTGVSADAKAGVKARAKAATKARAKAGAKAGAKAAKKPAMPWMLEERHILRKLEVVANHSLHYLGSLRHGSRLHEGAMTDYEFVPLAPHDTIDAKLCPIPRCPPMQRHATYRFISREIDELHRPSAYDLKLAGAATRWHSRVFYFTVVIALRRSLGSLEVFIRWGRTLDVARRPPQISKVMLVHRKHAESCPMEKVKNLPADAVFLPGFHDRFKKGVMDLKDEGGFVEDGELKIEVYIAD